MRTHDPERKFDLFAVPVSRARPEARVAAGRWERVVRLSYDEAMSGMRREPDLAQKGGEGRVMTPNGPTLHPTGTLAARPDTTPN